MGGETEIPGEFFRFGKRCLCSPKPFLGELSSAGSERLPYKQRVGGSNPSAPTNERRRLRFLKRLFLFSGRVGRCGTGRCGQCGSGRSRWTVRVEAVGAGRAGRGGRCGSRRSVRVEVDGAGRCGRCRLGRSVRAGSGRGGLGRAGQCGSVGAERGGGRSPGAPRRASGRVATVILRVSP